LFKRNPTTLPFYRCSHYVGHRREKKGAKSKQGLTKHRPHGYWTRDDGANMKCFMDDFASRKSILMESDPAISGSTGDAAWRKIRAQDIIDAGGVGILSHFGGSKKRALTSLYPNLALDSRSNAMFFRQWTHDHQRRFFDSFALENGFDPLIPANWTHVHQADLFHAGAYSFLRYYGGSHFKALVSVYPDLGLTISDFPNSSTQDWSTCEKRREFFNWFAASRGMDPLDRDFWCTVKKRDIIKAGGSGVLNYWKGSHINALSALYPELGLRRKDFF